MKLTVNSIKNEHAGWEKAGFILPKYDTEEAVRETQRSPEWIHFGAGNIFRGYIACLADELIGKGMMKGGIIAADTFDTEPIERIYRPFDNLVLLVGLRAQGERYLRVIGSIGRAEGASGEGLGYLKEAARKPSLKMISFTITEKGYAVTGIDGGVLPAAAADIAAGPEGELSTAAGKVSLLLYERFKAGGMPIALVSMDNCSRNGDKLRNAIEFTVKGWLDNGLVPEGFNEYVCGGGKVSFPWSMIDKITPRPDPAVGKELAELGIEGMEPIVTARKTFIAPYVNAEMPQYLVIEDDFPNGRPPLEEAGVYLTDRETVDRAEKMKVMTCLNPLHTALAVFGCLLGYKKISDEMNDTDLRELVYRLGYDEGLPVVVDPGIIRPEDFLREVLTERLPNPCLPDTPQRIATDTSQKLAIRFGETVKAYAAKGEAGKLRLIPLVIAAWLRYLLAYDDEGESFERSPDPMLSELDKCVKPEWFTEPGSFTEDDRKAVTALLSNASLFGTDLCAAGLSDSILTDFEAMLTGKGAVRQALKNALK
ncbi:MAG: mannitol dehydrogenase family protein [Ruminococcus sp.]|nr:mannitol dehydrogenase family protein [Ruminococcus sp.]